MAEQFLTAEEMSQERTPSELSAWVERKRSEIRNRLGGKEALRWGKGLCKQFAEEMIPLSIWATQYLSDAPTSTVKHVLGNQPYDAIVTRRTAELERVRYLEITQAREGEEEYLRKQVLFEQGWVWGSAPITKIGTKNRGMQIDVACPRTGTLIQEHTRRAEDLIIAAARRKTGGGYLKNSDLLIIFEDPTFHFDGVDQKHHAFEELVSIIEPAIIGHGLTFQHVYLVGWSRTLFCVLDLKG